MHYAAETASALKKQNYLYFHHSYPHILLGWLHYCCIFCLPKKAPTKIPPCVKDGIKGFSKWPNVD